MANDYGIEVYDANLYDESVLDCLMQMYFYMMTGDDVYFNKFHDLYSKLNDSQKEYVKKDYLNIIKAQDEKKQKEKIKVKTKGND